MSLSPSFARGAARSDSCSNFRCACVQHLFRLPCRSRNTLVEHCATLTHVHAQVTGVAAGAPTSSGRQNLRADFCACGLRTPVPGTSARRAQATTPSRVAPGRAGTPNAPEETFEMKTLVTSVSLAALLSIATAAQAKNWPVYGGDTGNTRYSPAAQVNTGNVNKLSVAWALQLGTTRSQESTPILVGDTLFVTSSFGPKNTFAVNAQDRRSEVDLPARRAQGHRPVRLLRREQPRRGLRRRQDLRRPPRRARGRARRQDRQGAVEGQDRRLRPGLGHHLAAHHREEHGHHRLRRRRVRRARRDRRRSTRPPARKSGAPTPCRRAARTAATPGRATRGKIRRRRGLAHRLLRPEAEPRLLRHQQPGAVVGSGARQRHVATSASSPTCTPPRCSRSTPTPARSSGTTSPRRTTRGTTTA